MNLHTSYKGVSNDIRHKVPAVMILEMSVYFGRLMNLQSNLISAWHWKIVVVFSCFLFSRRVRLVVCCLLFAVCCLLFAVCCLLFAVCCLLFAVCCLLFVVCCLLFVV